MEQQNESYITQESSVTQTSSQPECEDCPYASTGFICGVAGDCMRSRIAELYFSD